jgi:polyribonucleotide nucleotidyltransferase
MPDEEAFPYTVRIASEISESNGSSSMATVCGGSLALMDGGVPITAAVAGIAMGMVKEGDDLVILSDILGDEDHLGDMDFKVAGTAEGITAIQMDNKLGSLPPEVMAQAFEQARQGRVHILAEMAKVLAQPREQVKPHAPLIRTLSISPDKIRDLIGPGGKIIQEIQRNTESRVEVDDTGTVRIFSPNAPMADAAEEAVMNAAGTAEVGQIYTGVVTGVKDFGAFVRIRGGEGLVHISEWAPERTESMAAVVKLGDEVQVKVLPSDKPGKVSLSRKAAL